MFRTDESLQDLATIKLLQLELADENVAIAMIEWYKQESVDLPRFIKACEYDLRYSETKQIRLYAWPYSQATKPSQPILKGTLR